MARFGFSNTPVSAVPWLCSESTTNNYSGTFCASPAPRLFRRALLIYATSFLFVALNAPSVAQTKQFLDAPVVRYQIVVRWNPSAKSMQFALDDDPTFRTIGANSLFLAKQGVYVTYPSLNPLVVQASASAPAVADPGFTAISKLIDAITGVVTTVAPVPLAANVNAARMAAAGPCSDPATDIGNLVQLLYGPSTQPDALKKQVASWAKIVDDAYAAGLTGPQAITAAVDKIRDASNSIQTSVNNSKAALSILQNCKNTVGGVYAAALLSDPSVRIQELTDTAGALTKLADLLHSQFADTTKWIGPRGRNYIISDEIDATSDKMQNVTVKVVNIAFNVASTSSVTMDQAAAGSVTFSVRKYSSFTPEVGVGAVFGTVTAPVYGTAQNASGQTIVARKPNTSLSVNPTVLVNFVCRCGTGLLTPMAQVGAAASKTTPAILLGGGVRLFGLSKGDVALGGGAMFAWVKDLQKLKVGDVIGGTNDINSDLGFNGLPKVGGYFAIQYKF